MRQIKSLEEIFKIKNNSIYERLIDDFTNLDLSNLDLSLIPSSLWKDCLFHNTNFTNTNIKFYPHDLKKDTNNKITSYSIESCNFTNCDLSYLTEEDIKSTNINNCTFTNTNLNINFNKINYLIRLYNVTLPESYTTKDYDYWDKYNILLDLDFLKNNKNIKVSSAKLYEIIGNILTYNISYRNKTKILEIYNEIIKYDSKKQLINTYNYFKDLLTTDEDVHDFFTAGHIMDKDIDTLNLDYLKSDIIIKLFYCNINNLIIPKDLDNIKDYLFNTKNEKYVLHQSTVKNIKTNLTYHDWNNNMEDRLLGSHVTYETNIYVELKRICNMNCQFCRNKYLNNQEYNYNNIIKNLRKIYYNINNIVIGGGEPTLLLEDLKRLKQDVQKDLLETDTNFNIITNASLNVNSYNDLLKDYNIYFSRHAIDDYTNSLIFNDKNNNLLSANDLTKLTSKNLHKSHRMKNNKILCCTCVIGGIDSKTKILDYIKFAKEIGFNEVLFQTLDQDSLFLNNYDIGIKTINEQEIIKAFNYLERNGYNISNPIYSSSGYELYLLTNPTINMDISFKIYKKQEEIKTSWQTASKRCFDLSMDPSGEIYEDWQEKNKVYMYK